MKRFRNISAILLWLFLPGIILGGNLPYRSDRLERMGELLGEEKLAALPDGEHTAALMFMGTPVTLIKEKGIIEHIGYSFFSAEERRLTSPVVCDFLERYALEADLPVKKEKTIDMQLLEDGIVFSQGSLASLKTLCPGGHGILELHNISHLRYIFKWQEGQMLFPSDVELLTGRDMKENDRRLPLEIQSAIFSEQVQTPDSTEVRDDGIAVCGNGYYYFPSLSADTFFTGENMEPVNNILLEKETVHNLAAGLIRDSKITLDISMSSYGLKRTHFTTEINSIAAYATSTGCKAYSGVISMNQDEIETLVIYSNEAASYNHILRLQIPHSALVAGEGQGRARLTPFVPTHSIKYLFEEIQK